MFPVVDVFRGGGVWGYRCQNAREHAPFHPAMIRPNCHPAGNGSRT
jgi:hypothetical protein